MGGCATKKKSAQEFLKEEAVINANELYNDEEGKESVSEKIRLHFKCSGVKDTGMASEPSTKLVVKEKKGEDEWALVGQTEIVVEDANPKYVNSVQAIYKMQDTQEFKVEMYEVSTDQDPNNVKEQYCLGSADFLLHELMKEENKTIEIPLKEKRKKKCGMVTIIFERVANSNKIKTLTIAAEINPWYKLGIDFYYKVYREISGTIVPLNESSSNQENLDITKMENLMIVYDSKYGGPKQHELAYTWKQLKGPYSVIACGDPNMPLIIEIGYKEPISSNEEEEVKYINKRMFCQKVSVCSLQRAEVAWPLELNGERFGVFKFGNPLITEEYSFMDYINGGVSLKLCVGFDWTLSNNRPSQKLEYHNLDLDLNPYGHILRTLGRAILCFDKTAKIPMIALGGAIPDVGRSYCFALNGKMFEPEVVGISSAIELYLNALKKAGLAGPTYFSELLSYYADYIESYVKCGFEENPRYFTILFIIDGSPIDIEETKDELVRLSYLPATLIIITVNPELTKPFQDAINPENQLFSNNLEKAAKRDGIIFTSYDNDPTKLRGLVRSIFPGIQKQFVEYMNQSNIDPKRTPSGSGTGQAEITKGSMESSFSPYITMLNNFKRATLELRQKTKEAKEEFEMQEAAANGKQSDASKKKSAEELQEEEKKEHEELEKIEKIVNEGFPVRDPYLLLKAVALKEYKNALIVDESLKLLIEQ